MNLPAVSTWHYLGSGMFGYTEAPSLALSDGLSALSQDGHEQWLEDNASLATKGATSSAVGGQALAAAAAAMPLGWSAEELVKSSIR